MICHALSACAGHQQHLEGGVSSGWGWPAGSVGDMSQTLHRWSSEPAHLSRGITRRMRVAF